jgi:hypothetical protein
MMMASTPSLNASNRPLPIAARSLGTLRAVESFSQTSTARWPASARRHPLPDPPSRHSTAAGARHPSTRVFKQRARHRANDRGGFADAINQAVTSLSSRALVEAHA